MSEFRRLGRLIFLPRRLNFVVQNQYSGHNDKIEVIPSKNMPRKFIRRLLPDLTAALKHPSMRWAAPLIRDPNIMHLNRESVSLAVFIGVLIAFLPFPARHLSQQDWQYGGALTCQSQSA